MLIEWTTDLIVFAAIAGVSVTLLVLSLFLGEVFELGESFFGDGDGPFFTDSTTVFAFFTAFGATAWLASGQFEMSGLASSGIGIVGGIVIGAPVGFMLRVFKKNAGATNFSLEDVVGATGVVVLSIPASQNGRVEVTMPGKGSTTLLARSTSGVPVQQGSLVTIDRIVSSTAYVTETGGQKS